MDALQDLIQSLQEKDEQRSRITRSIHFNAEHRQAGLSILSYFATVVEQKYPKKEVRVQIEQIGSLVRLSIETDEGDKETIEKTLDEYGRVVTGQMVAAEFLEHQVHVVQLESKLDLAQTELRMNERLLDLHVDTIGGLQDTIQLLTSVHREAHESLRLALEHHNSNSSVGQAVELLERMQNLTRLTHEDKESIINAIHEIKEKEPSILEKVDEFFMGVSSSVVGSFVTGVLRGIG